MKKRNTPKHIYTEMNLCTHHYRKKHARSVGGKKKIMLHGAKISDIHKSREKKFLVDEKVYKKKSKRNLLKIPIYKILCCLSTVLC